MNEHSPFFSIITVSYNSARTIEMTIRSVLEQSYKDYEYIIVDGASTDCTMSIVRQYEPLFGGRMRWVSEPDSGIYNAMNKGVRLAKGSVIGIVNSDDWLEPDALRDVSHCAMSETECDNVLYAGSIVFHYQNGVKQLMMSDRQRFYEGIPHHSYNYGLFHPATFVGRRVYDEVGLFDENFKIEADTDFIYRCYVAHKKFVFLCGVLSNMQDGGASNKIRLKKYYKEKCYFAEKNNITGIKAWLFLSKCMMKMMVKNIMPDALMWKIRKKGM